MSNGIQLILRQHANLLKCFNANVQDFIYINTPKDINTVLFLLCG